MYQCYYNVVVYSRDNQLIEILSDVHVSERFHLTYFLFTEEEQENTIAGDIIIWDLEAQPVSSLDTQQSKDHIFVLCAEQAVLEQYSEKQMAVYAAVWQKPMTKVYVQYSYRKLLEKLLLEKEYWLTKNYLDTTIDTIPDMIWYKDINGVHWKVNDSFCKAVDKTKEQITGRGHCYIWDLDMAEYKKGEYVCLETDETVQEKRETCLFEEKVKCKDGMRLLKTYKSPIFAENGEILGTVGIAHDITNLSNLYIELNIMLDSLPFSAALLNTEDVIQSVNKRLAGVFGIAKEKMTGTTFREWESMASLQAIEGIRKKYHAHMPATGEDIILEMLKENLIDVFGNVVGSLVMFRDVTLEQKVYEKTLLDANTDYLTGLFNRRYLNEYIENNRGKHRLTLLFLDVDNFKHVNDTYGHPVGDGVLIDIANQLKKYFREQKIFRLGGDEFLVVLPDLIDLKSVERTGEEVRLLMEKRFREDLNYPMLSVSIGVARDTEESISPDDLLKRGDAALYQAKQKGKNCIYIWDKRIS